MFRFLAIIAILAGYVVMSATTDLLSRAAVWWLDHKPFSAEAKARRQAKRKARRARRDGLLPDVDGQFFSDDKGDDMDALKGALKSKLVWLGVAQLLYSLFETWANGGLNAESVSTALSGALTILFRAMTDKPLAAK